MSPKNHSAIRRATDVTELLFLFAESSSYRVYPSFLSWFRLCPNYISPNVSIYLSKMLNIFIKIVSKYFSTLRNVFVQIVFVGHKKPQMYVAKASSILPFDHISDFVRIPNFIFHIAKCMFSNCTMYLWDMKSHRFYYWEGYKNKRKNLFLPKLTFVRVFPFFGTFL